MSDGKFFEGNLFTKGMDVLNIPQYFLAGFADSLFSGENPFEGGFNGIEDRHSFVDTLKHHNVPLATPLGIIADIAVPGTLFGKIAKIGKARDIARALKTLRSFNKAEDLAKELDIAHDLAVKGESIADIAHAEQTLDTVQDSAGAARAAYERTGSEAAAATAGVARNQTKSAAHVVEEELNAAQTRRAKFSEAFSARERGQDLPHGYRNINTSFLPKGVREFFGIDDAGVLIPSVKDWAGNVFGDGFSMMRNHAINTVEKTLNNSALFAGVGPTMARAVSRAQKITTHMRAAYLRRGEEILSHFKDFKSEGDLYIRLKYGIELTPQQTKALASNADLRERMEKILTLSAKYFDDDFVLKTANNVQEMLGEHTTILRSLPTEERELALHLFKNPNSGTMGRMLSMDDTRWERRIAMFVKNVIDDGGNLDEFNLAITSPLKRVNNYLNVVYSKRQLAKMYRDSYIEAVTMELKNKNLYDPQFGIDIRKQLAAAGVAVDDMAGLEQKIRFNAERVARAATGDPNEIIAGFQHSRRNPIELLKNKKNIKDLSEFIETDPRVLFAQHAADSGLVLGVAKSFGGKNELFHAIRSQYLTNHGISNQFRPEEMNSATKYGLEFIDRLFRLTAGTQRNPSDKFVGLAGQLADAMFLGPRTVFVQTMNLANSAAHVGVANAFATMAETLTNPELRSVGARVAGVLPNALDVTTSSTKFEQLMSKFGFIYKGIKGSDTLMRSQSAIGGLLDAFQRESKILKLIESGNVDKAKKLISQLHLDYGADVSYLINNTNDAANAIKNIKAEDLYKIAQSAAAKANFSNELLKSAMIFNTPTGKFFLKFKQFSAHQVNFIGEMTKRFMRTKDPSEIARYVTVFPWVQNQLKPLLDLFKSKAANEREKKDAMGKIQSILMMGAFGYMGDAALALSSESEALGLGVVTGPIPNAALKAKSTLWHLTPLAWDPEKATQSGPAVIRQVKNLWANSTQ